MCSNHPETIPSPSVEKSSSMKLVPGAKKVGDHCSIFICQFLYIEIILQFKITYGIRFSYSSPDISHHQRN